MMNRRAFSFLAAAPLILAAGCITPTADETVEEQVGVVQEKSAPSATAVVEKLGESALRAAVSAGLGDVIGGGLLDLIFPPGGALDTQALIDALTTVINSTVEGYLLWEYQTNVSAASLNLNTLQSSWLSSPTGSSTQNKYTEVDTTAANTLHQALKFVSGAPTSVSGTPPGATPQNVIDAAQDLKRDGFYLYIATAQLDISRLQLLMAIDQSKNTDDGRANFVVHRNQMIAALATYLPYVRQEITARANTDVRNAVNRVHECYRSGYWTVFGDETYAYRFQFDDIDNTWGGWGGQSQASNESVARARCDEGRDRFLDQARRVAQAEATSKYAFATRMFDLWTTTLDTWNAQLTNAERGLVDIMIASPGAPLPASRQTTRKLPLDFGGMRGYGSQSTSYPNPITGTLSCPAGFGATAFLGTAYVDYDAAVCARTLPLGVSPALDFGGMYGEMDGWQPDDKVWPNPLTGAASCPAGYTATQVLGADADHRLFYCSRPHSAAVRGQWLFGGMFSYTNGSGTPVVYPNPVTNDATCPLGYAASIVLGSTGANGTVTDNRVAFCYKLAGDEDFGPTNTQVRLRSATGQCAYHAPGEGVHHSGCWANPDMAYYFDVLTMGSSSVPGTVRLRHAADNNCIQPGTGGTAGFAPCTEDPGFTFTVVPVSGTPVIGQQFQLKSAANLCLQFGDVEYASMTTQACSSDSKQVFTLEQVKAVPKVRLRHDRDGQCLYNTAGGGVSHWDCWGDPNMSYYLDPVAVDANSTVTAVRLRHAVTNTCLAITGSTNPGVVTSAPCWEDPNFVFQLNDLGGGKYQLASQAYDQCVFTNGGNGMQTTNWSCWGDSNFTFDLDSVQ